MTEEKLLAQKIRDTRSKKLTDEHSPKESSEILKTREYMITCTKLAENHFETFLVLVTIEEYF